MTGWAGYFFWAIPVFLGHLEELPGTHNQCCLLLSPSKPKYIRPSDHSSKCSRLKTPSLHLIVKSGWVSSEEEMEMRGKMPPRAQFPAVRSSGDLKKHPEKNYTVHALPTPDYDKIKLSVVSVAPSYEGQPERFPGRPWRFLSHYSCWESRNDPQLKPLSQITISHSHLNWKPDGHLNAIYPYFVRL